MTDYNASGIKYSLKSENIHAVFGGYLPHPVILDFERIKMELLKSIQRNSNNAQLVRGTLGVLSQIAGFLYQAERFFETLSEIQKSAFSPVPNRNIPRVILKEGQYHTHNEFLQPPALIWLSSQTIEFDFDTLLARGHAVLERVAKFSCKTLQLPEVRSFFKFKDHIESKSKKDQRIGKIIELLEDLLPELENILISDGQGKSMRNTLAHHSSASELTGRGMSINWLEDGRLLAFDLEIGGYPLVGTAHKLIGAISHFIFNALRILLSFDDKMLPDSDWSWFAIRPRVEFNPTWSNPMIHYESYIDHSKTGPKVSVIWPRFGSIEPHTQHLKPEVFKLAVKPVKQS